MAEIVGNGPSRERESQESGPSSREIGDEARRAVSEKYAPKTSAQILSEGDFQKIKSRDGLYVVGVAGFSGQWDEGKIDADPDIKASVEAAASALEAHILKLKEKHGEKLIVSSGGTAIGVPKIIYDICAKEGVAAMGIACDKAADYELGRMKYLIIEGQDWGAESPVFIGTADEIIVLGGGGQAKREAIAADAEGKKISIYKGYGGAGDQLAQADLKHAEYFDRPSV